MFSCMAVIFVCRWRLFKSILSIMLFCYFVFLVPDRFSFFSCSLQWVCVLEPEHIQPGLRFSAVVISIAVLHWNLVSLVSTFGCRVVGYYNTFPLFISTSNSGPSCIYMYCASKHTELASISLITMEAQQREEIICRLCSSDFN